MSDVDHRELLNRFATAIREQDWDALEGCLYPDAVFEYPQSGERFRGLANIRAQFENYAGLEGGATELQDVIGGTEYALTQNYTVIAVEGSGDRGVAIMRTRYPDQSRWWIVNVYQLRDGLIASTRTFFAQEFEPPEWRAPFRDPA